MHITFVGYSWNIQGIFLYSIFLEHLFWEYSPEFHRDIFLNISGIYHGNAPGIFHEHIFARWVVESGINEDDNDIVCNNKWK